MNKQNFLVDENWTRKFESYEMNKLQGEITTYIGIYLFYILLS